ncbi:MAG TPA: SNF2-related protein, partial [Nitrospiria bacterium]|nr:SNF2-related protein [Nitrospiria bacterium]
MELTLTDSGTLWARVQGTEPRPYLVTVAPVGPTGLLWECTCPYFRDRTDEACKHVIAVLLAWVSRRDRAPRRDSAPVLRRPRQVAPWTPTWAPTRFLPPRQEPALPSVLDSATWTELRLDVIESAGGPPRVEVRFKPHGDEDSALLTLPPGATPDALMALRGRATYSPTALNIRLLRTPLRAELHASYDAAGRLVLTPSFRQPSRAGRNPGPRIVIVNPSWIWSDGVFFRTEVVPDAFRPYFSHAEPTVLEGDAIHRFLEHDAPRLSEYPRYRPSHDVRQSRLLPAPRFNAVSVFGKDRDWFWLDPLYQAGEHRFTLSELLDAAERNKPVRRGNDWIAPPTAVSEAWEASGGRLDAGRVVMPRLGYLRRRADWGDLDVERDATVRRFEADLDRLTPARPAPEPPDYKGSLRPYQRTGYDWLWFLHVNGFHGVLADEMGLGKTHMTMALLLAAGREDAVRPSLIVCPTSVIDHWEDKLHEYAPSLAPLRYHGMARTGIATGALPPVVLTSYAILARDSERFRAIEWNYVVLDEAQKIKNPATQSAKAAKTLSARHRLALTGTPIENRLAELWSIFDFLLPGYLGSARSF